jgi:hypothetical protein
VEEAPTAAAAAAVLWFLWKLGRECASKSKGALGRKEPKKDEVAVAAVAEGGGEDAGQSAN